MGKTDKNKSSEHIDYNPKYNEQYLKMLREKAKKSWLGVDADKWLREIRGYDND